MSLGSRSLTACLPACLLAQPQQAPNRQRLHWRRLCACRLPMGRSSRGAASASAVNILQTAAIDSLEQRRRTASTSWLSRTRLLTLATTLPFPLASDYVCDGEVLPETHKHGPYMTPSQLRGVNLGGWLVLQPWITPRCACRIQASRARSAARALTRARASLGEPRRHRAALLCMHAMLSHARRVALGRSLFYQFEDKPEASTAMDMHSFCHVLGPVEGNRQLREHWRKWVTEQDLVQLAGQGINSLRVPVGDWMFEPYEPFTGCTNGSVAELHRLLHLADKVGLKVLIDMHGVREDACIS